MLIWGTRGRQMKIGEGSFNCPQCQMERAHTHKRSSLYFTLFFIPIFPIRNLGEYVECDGCAQAFDVRVLEYVPPTEAESLSARVRQELETGLPIHMMEKKLSAEGVGPQESSAALEAATRGMLKTCGGCGFSYISTATLCSNCGGDLSLS